MSGDELDTTHNERSPRYVVTKLRWRSSEFEYFLRIFDWMWLHSRYHADGRVKKGGIPRQRRRGSNRKESMDDPVPGLPRNCYDAAYLDGLRAAEYDALNIEPSVDLSHTEAVTR